MAHRAFRDLSLPASPDPSSLWIVSEQVPRILVITLFVEFNCLVPLMDPRRISVVFTHPNSRKTLWWIPVHAARALAGLDSSSQDSLRTSLLSRSRGLGLPRVIKIWIKRRLHQPMILSKLWFWQRKSLFYCPNPGHPSRPIINTTSIMAHSGVRLPGILAVALVYSEKEELGTRSWHVLGW